MKKISRRIIAGAAASALALSLAACTQEAQEDVKDSASAAADAADEAASDAGSKVAEATDELASAAADASTAIATAVDEAGKKADEAGDKVAEEAKDALAAVKTAAGDIEVPSAFSAELDKKSAEWGDIQDIKHNDKGYLASYAGNHLMVFNKETGETVPVIGKIAETYIANGGLDAEVGLPVHPEQVVDHATGWNQEFTNGTISWMADATGEFGADIRMM